MDIKLDHEAVAAIAATAIFDQLEPEAREQVMKQAVQALLTPEKDRLAFSYGKTPLQEAFERAVTTAADRVVRERIAEDPQIRQALNDLIGPVVTSAMEAEAENYDSSLAHAIGRAVGAWLSEQARKETR